MSDDTPLPGHKFIYLPYYEDDDYSKPAGHYKIQVFTDNYNDRFNLSIDQIQDAGAMLSIKGNQPFYLTHAWQFMSSMQPEFRYETHPMSQRRHSLLAYKLYCDYNGVVAARDPAGRSVFTSRTSMVLDHWFQTRRYDPERKGKSWDPQPPSLHPKQPSIFLQALAERNDYRVWQSDLYVEATPSMREYAKAAKMRATPFKCQVTGKYMLEFAFQYDPYWWRRGMGDAVTLRSPRTCMS